MDTNIHTQRIASLDILRGVDLFLLTFFQPIFLAMTDGTQSTGMLLLRHQFEHKAWEGMHLWDLVMPLFLFMAGTSMPFSFAKYTGSISKRPIYTRIIKRVLLLYLLGMIVQGNLLAFDINTLKLFSNTLQAIAIGYLISALFLLHTSIRGQIIGIGALLLIYSIPIVLCNDYTPKGNFANQIDQLILGGFRDDVTYTWIWSSLTFGVTVMLGSLAGEMIRRWQSNPQKVVKSLLLTGSGLIVLGLVWSTVMPIIKHLWTGSMTLFSGGLCFLLLALFYYITDARHYSKGLEWLKIYGMNSITAYVISEVIDFKSVVDSLTYGLKPYMGDQYGLCLVVGNYIIVFLILLFLYRRNIFLKV